MNWLRAKLDPEPTEPERARVTPTGDDTQPLPPLNATEYRACIGEFEQHPLTDEEAAARLLVPVWR